MSELSVNSFCPGQRWVSNTEAELGLGIIVDADERMVEISFPAVGERRHYAISNAPLNRVIYHKGDSVSTIDNQLFTIEHIEEDEGILIYAGLTANGEEVNISELELTSFIQFSAPKDRLFAGQLDSPKSFALRYRTLQELETIGQQPVQGLSGARVQLLPHQLYIAEQVASRYAPRVLLADEVGLGKTIEAGMIIHKQLFTGMAERVLIVLPDSLVHQWLVEMLRRFNLSFSIIDQARCEAIEDNENPFESSQLIITQLSFLTENPERLQEALACDWDLLVVDEAHHLEWSESGPSQEYQCVQQLAEHSRGLLLLTATPEQLGIEGHFARLQLLDPDRYPSLEQYLTEEESYTDVNHLVMALQKGEALSDAAVNQLQEWLGEHQWSHYQQLIGEPEKAAQYAIARILDQHGTGRVLMRNTRDNIAGFPSRKLLPYPLPKPADWRDDFSQLERGLDGVLQAEHQWGLSWLNHDDRVQWLKDWLKQHRHEKTLLICHHADTALDLESHIRLRVGLASAVFHEGMSLLERDRAAAYFADQEDGADILICSEIGSEGRNFQFAQHLILFDLPSNPDLLEQRIGRLDRIGQENTVQIHVPYYQDTAQEVLLNWYHQGLNAFEHACPGAHHLRQQFGDTLDQALTNAGAEHSQLHQQTAEARDALNAKLAEGRNHLLELSSFNQEHADELVQNISEHENDGELLDYLESVFDSYGVDSEGHSEATLIMRPGDHMREGHFPGLPEDGFTGTVSRQKALHRDDMQFLSWEHPMVVGAMDMIRSGDKGNTCICSIKLPPLKAGNLLLEAIFTMSYQAPKHLQLSRYMPVQAVRVVVDANDKDFSNIIKVEHFNQLGQKIPKRTAQEIARQGREAITSLIDKAEQMAAPEQEKQRQAALDRANDQLGEEIERLQALAQVNPNIRQEEVEHLITKRDAIREAIASAQLNLDAIRIALTT
ncbi:RNA polymerase-associated protein RapA [Pseudoteredinibacter isoporae]|uniref:RNA polymerase-associated protein RapA n=1 Tax=Pseudoteredinibacter isoporae TaxID=570281 RepID=A0A7X0JXP1_9GAMM|nr:RNA polymerase-associated protein RapA [Pseudoteredinibacter isoporae]MBB6523331.1 ATP-dependent helicase HepA [Pseudoteredinibacter isoporae]NHO88845.1 RNA polymerase-associated protein RapA [Pseudoteredinibacter isoporae]NIB24447.1 RNA polymerase-associated protein RapA [Pseudoteredinibacter isoporae]